MPACIRQEDKAAKIARNILGEPNSGYVDSSGKQKKYRKKRDVKNEEQEKTNRFQEIGLIK